MRPFLEGVNAIMSFVGDGTGIRFLIDPVVPVLLLHSRLPSCNGDKFDLNDCRDALRTNPVGGVECANENGRGEALSISLLFFSRGITDLGSESCDNRLSVVTLALIISAAITARRFTFAMIGIIFGWSF
jgi:hypothetical protein